MIYTESILLKEFNHIIKSIDSNYPSYCVSREMRKKILEIELKLLLLKVKKELKIKHSIKVLLSNGETFVRLGEGFFPNCVSYSSNVYGNQMNEHYSNLIELGIKESEYFSLCHRVNKYFDEPCKIINLLDFGIFILNS